MKENDMSKVALLYELYYVRMFHVAYRIVRDKYLAEDVVHNVYAKLADRSVLVKLQDVNSDSTIGYITRMAINFSYNEYRNRKKELGLIGFDEISESVEDVRQKDTLNQMIEKSSKEELSEILNRMPERYRVCLRLRYFEEKSMNGISYILGLKSATVRKQIERGKRILKEKLESDHRDWKERV